MAEALNNNTPLDREAFANAFMGEDRHLFSSFKIGDHEFVEQQEDENQRASKDLGAREL